MQTRFDFTSPEYADLFARSDATPFQHPLWLERFYSVLAAHRGAEKIVLSARDSASGALRVVVPLIRRRKTGVTLIESTDLGVSDYAAPVMAVGWNPPAGLAEAFSSALPDHDLLRIRPIRAETVAAWRACLNGTTSDLGFCAHATSLFGDYATWRRQALDASFARYLDRRKKRFLKQPGAGFRPLTGAHEIARAIDMLRARRAGRFDSDPIQQEAVARFYTAIAMEGAEAGLARTYALCLGGEEIGHVFGLSRGDRFLYLLIGCDYERHGRHSPGLIAYDLMIEDWMGNGGTVFDFTIGDEAFKQDFATQPTSMFMLTATPTWRGRLAQAAYDARTQLRRLQIGGRRPAAGKRDGENDDAA